jgi:hypothetical protein
MVGLSLGRDQSGSLVRRGRHTPRITFAVATASITQSEFHSAANDAPRVAGSAS